MRFYSVVIPIYNRPDEIKELLESLTKQTYTNFEVIIVEDGSKIKCADICNSFKDKLNLQYFYKENSGQGFSRNFGFEKATGDYYIVFDSDCIIPKDYFETVDDFLNENPLDAFGGPDAALDSFTIVQKAISYSMTSFFTTGGIRGGNKQLEKFRPRSFNMGISRAVYEKTGGYNITRMGEDIEFSIRIEKAGFKTGLIPDARVYHKRRTKLDQFYKQLFFFGRGRINIFRFYKSELKAVHLLPVVFVLGLFFWLSTALWQWELFQLGATLLAVYFILIGIDAFMKTKNFLVAWLSLITSFIQLFAYGMGFLKESLAYLRQPEPEGVKT
ncbi:glycosyl transferase [Marivirga tractuosa]|uniref:Glycosyl transferase family 2 n=1 Tax=Marivirga tractuosa (strain ATCC 23168 / DSM 4126 / NBRC 15989 / NCIMB 1408 / VKM B-1430 / H-43) TaxID=643867 RepID=E4TTI0_MARTH|nr:glycosyltransferase [Marivirga tractuosa]ADR22983.1 glycosyl transferase family 2 [Marivirga tractuosa DSM 4126]BDD16343.1 glycosyl transferase [Marivirga tractuosa]